MPRNRALRSPSSGHLLLPAAAAIGLAAVLALLAGSCGSDSPQLTVSSGASTSSTAGAQTTADARSADAAAASSTTDTADAEIVIAPALQVTLFDGTVFDLTGHLSRDGRPVLLQLWSSSCPACLEEMPALDDAARSHPEILFVGIALGDDPEAAAAAAAATGAAYALGADLDGSAAAAFPAVTLPAVFLIDGDGTVLGAVYGPLGPEGISDLIDRYLAG